MSSSDDEHEVYGPENYKSRAHKLVTLFIMTAGSANARQFPTMFIVNGGMPFLLAYLAFLGVVAFPIMHLESNLAQFAGDGNFGVFSTVPLFIGVGYTMSLYAIVHMVADSVPVSDQLQYLFDSLRQAGGNECQNGLLLASNRTCYVPRHTFSLCRTTRAQLAEAFRRHPLNQGIPVVESGSTGTHVVMVPPEVFRHDMAGCLPGVYNYLQPYQPRRHVNWLEGSSSPLSEIQAQPLLSLAAIWMVVFALAHQRFNRVKWVLYVMVCIHVATTLLLLVRGASLPGAMSGLGTMFYTDWSYAVNIEMWSNALYVSLESVGVTGSIYLGIVRFNNFKNVYQRDVYFGLVADTATEVLRTAITFMFLGHLASTVGVDVRMLVGIESGVVVGILPQAMSVVPYQELWGQVHALWLLSTMLPKFLIVPDIVIEVLTPAQPFILLNRTLIYFFLCVSILMTSAVVCSPFGANVAAIIAHNHDQTVRFVVLFLESIVLLQFYGARRLDIACRMMTGRECSEFVKVCLASLIPLIIIILFLGKLASKLWEGSNFPIWIYAVITWFWLVQLSFIPVFAVVLLTDQNLTFENLLVPLPTWVPLNWELAMYYRKTLVVEGFDSNAVKNPEARPPAQASRQPPQKSSKRGRNRSSSSTKSSTEIMGSDFVVASDRAYAGPGTDTLLRARARKASADGRAQNGVPSQSGTLHVTRHPSSVRRSASRERLEQEEPQRGKPPVAMPLASEAEDPQEARAFALLPPLPSSALPFKESSEVPGVVIAPPPELPKKFGPEASSICKEAHPARVARDDVRKKHFGTGDRSAQHKPADRRAIEDTTSSTTAPKALPGKLLSSPSPTDDVHRPSKGDLCPEPGRNEKPKESMDEIPSEPAATRGFEKPAEKPAVREAAPLEADEPQPKVKQQRAQMGAVGGAEERGAARPDSAGKNAMDKRPNLRARRRRLKHLERQAAAHPNYVHYKPTMAMLPVEGDTTFLGGPTAVAIVKHGEKAATGESQGVLPQIHEPMKKSFGQEGSLSSRKSTKSAESAANLASSENAPVRNVEENPVSAQNLPKTGKRASLSVSSVRVLGESAAIKRPPDVSVTKPSIHEDPCTNVDAAVLAKNIPKSTVATAEQLGAAVDDRPQVPSAEEKPKRDPIPEAKREKKIKSKTRRKGHKRHHKKETG